MNAALWAHPWDLVDEGPAAAADRLADLGVGAVNVATVCHGVQTLNPHNPERKTFFADASAYFQPDHDRYGAIAPPPNDEMGEDDWLATVAGALDGHEVDLNAWLTPFHSSVLGKRHPEATMVNAFGDDLRFGLCPSNPAVREYGVALCEDLAARDWFDRIEVELADYQYGTGYGWHHQEFFTDLGQLGEFLFGVCFCEHCTGAAERAGVDAGRARESVRDALEAVFDGDLDPDLDPGGWLREHPHVGAYLDVRESTLGDLFERFADATGDAEFVYYLKYGGLGDDRMGVEHSWKHGIDLGALSAAADAVTVLAYHPDPAVVEHDVVNARTLTDTRVEAGLLAGHPVVRDEATLRSQVERLADLGVGRVSFYGYGVVRERNLEWIGRALP